MHIGQRVQVEAYHSDGTRYRWWVATVEEVDDERVVVFAPAGHRVTGLDRSWSARHAIRTYFWTGRRYSLLEVYQPDGTLDQVYVNINGLVQVEDGRLTFVDYELDVSYRPPAPPVILDQDEFEEAAASYGYSAEFQAACYRTAREAIRLAETWTPRGLPPAGDPRSDPSP
jgi:protein associated with RNAse G/E